MKINFNTNGTAEIINENGNLMLSMNDIAQLSYTLRCNDIEDNIKYYIEEFKDECPFDILKEEILNDNDILFDMVEDVIYNDINLDDEDEFYDLLEKWVGIKEETY